MPKTLTRHGNSFALLIDKGIMELLNIDSDTPLEIRTNGESLIVTPCRSQLTDAGLAAALKSVNEEFGDVLKNLAK